MSDNWLEFVNDTDRYSDGFFSLLQRDLPDEGNDLKTQWLRTQCNFRGLDSSGTFSTLKARLTTLSRERELALTCFQLEARNHQWNEDDFTTELGRVMEGFKDGKTPLAIKVHASNRLAALRACASMSLAHKSMQPPPGVHVQSRWIVIGKDSVRVREKFAEIEHRVDPEAQSRAENARRAENQKTALVEQEEAKKRMAQSREDRDKVAIHVSTAFLQHYGTDLAQAKDIKERYLTHNGELFDPDVDVWIPDDPHSSRLGLTRTRISERTKAYWEAQCFLRGLPSEGHIIALQGRLRERDEAVEKKTEPLRKLCELLLDAEWRLQHPQTRFNVRAVRKARKIMLHPEENAIARGWMTSRDIRPETLARLEISE